MLSGGATTLMYACQQCRGNEVSDILKKQPCSVKDRDRTLKTPLHYCAENPNTSCAETVLKAAPELVNAQDENGYSPLHLAVIAGNKPLIKLLIAKGADVNIHDNEGHSAVHWAIVSSEKEALEMIIRAGADPSTPDIHGGYPLHYAVQMCGSNSERVTRFEDAIRVVETLLNFGVDVNVRDKDGRQPILWAASAGSADAVILLVSGGACVEAADKDELTALHCAASRGHTTTLETLISLCGANVDVIDGNGCSALFYSVTLGHADATELLLRLGAEPNRQDRKGRTPAHCGAAKGQLETLRILQKHGGNLWMRNVKGDIPLHEAVASGRKDLVLWLLSQNHEAINIANNDGRCPLHIASMYNNTEMVKVLLDSKSLVNPVMRTSKGVLMTPLNVALSKGHRSCGKYLQLHGGVPFSKVSKTEPTSGVRISPTNDTIIVNAEMNKEMSSQSTISRSPADGQGNQGVIKTESVDKKKVYRRRKKKKNSSANTQDTDSDDSSQEVKPKTPERLKDDENEEKKKRKKVQLSKKSPKNLQGKEDVVKTTKTKPLLKNKSFNETKNVSDLSPEDFPPLMQAVDQLDAVMMKPEPTVVDEEADEKERKEMGQVKNSETEAVHKKKEEMESRTVKSFQGKVKDEENSVDLKKLDETKTENVGAPKTKNDLEEANANKTDKKENGKNEGKKISKSVEEEIPRQEVKEEEEILKSEKKEIKKDVKEDNKKQVKAIVEEEIIKKEVKKQKVEKNVEEDSVKKENEKIEAKTTGTELEKKTDKSKEKKSGNVMETETKNNEESSTVGENIVRRKEAESGEIKESGRDVVESRKNELESTKKDVKEETGKGEPENTEKDTKNESTKSQAKKTEKEKTDKNEVEEIEKKAEVEIRSDKIKPTEEKGDENREVRKVEEPKVQEINVGHIQSGPNVEKIEKIETNKGAQKEEISLPESSGNRTKIEDVQTPPESPTDRKKIEKPRKSSPKSTSPLHADFRHQEDKKSTTPETPCTDIPKEQKTEVKPDIIANSQETKTVGEKNSEELEIPVKTHPDIEEPLLSGIGYNPEEVNTAAEDITYEKTRDEAEPGFVSNPQKKMNQGRHFRTPKVSRLCRRHRDVKDDMSQVSVTQLVQNTIRKYHMERGIFYQLLELKRYQIRSGKANEQVLVKRLADEYERSRVFLGMKPFSGLYKFKEFEKFLYDQLKALNTRRSFIIPEVKSYDDIDMLSGFLKKSRYKIISETPQPELSCTCITQRCHHSACAYTNVPCSAYITDLRQYGHHKSKRNSFFPRIEPPVKAEDFADRPMTLELIQGSEKHVITLPQSSPAKGKRYYVTFTIKGAPGFKDEGYVDDSKDYLKHRHAKSV